METTQKCISCLLDLPLSLYYTHPYMANGHLGKCKECCKRDIRKNRAKRVEYYRGYDKLRAKRPLRKAMYDEKRKRELREHPEWTSARNAVRRAIKAGLLIRPVECESCRARCKPQAHHDDHAKKLDVMWLCPACHAQRHVFLKSIRGVS
jgi:hypothetical protein